MRLSKKTAAALSGLDWAINELIEKPQQPDEFTAREFFQTAQKADARLTLKTVRNKLSQWVSQGDLVTRKINVSGKRTNLYRRA